MGWFHKRTWNGESGTLDWFTLYTYALGFQESSGLYFKYFWLCLIQWLVCCLVERFWSGRGGSCTGSHSSSSSRILRKESC